MINFKKEYEKLKIIEDAAKRGKLVLFVGAGLSYLYNLPNWSKLAFKIIEKCKADGLISNEEKYTLLNSNFGSIQKISIIKEKYIEKNELDLFNDSVCSLLTINQCGVNKRLKNKILRIIKNIGCQVITTNADETFDDERFYKADKICKNVKKLTKDQRLTDFDVVHLHGSINEPNSLIFAACDYAELYSDEDFLYKLKDLFKNSDKVFLFIGYGLGDAELLRYIASNGINRDMHQAYVLSGYYKHQDLLLKSYYNYYKSLGIEQIAFSLNEKEYNEEIDILNEVSINVKKIRSRQFNSKIYKDVSKLCEYPPTSISINYIKQNYYIIFNFIFEILKESKYLYEWLEVLMENFPDMFNPVEHLKPKNNLKRKETDDTWNVLRILDIALSRNNSRLEFESKISEILNKSFTIIKKNNTLKSNYNNMYLLLNILFSRYYFIEHLSLSLDNVVKNFLTVPFIECDDVLSILCTNKKVALKIPDLSFYKMLKILLQQLIKDKKNYYYDDIFLNEVLKGKIKNEPSLYFDLFLECFTNEVKSNAIMFFSLAAFGLYKEDLTYLDDKDKLIIKCMLLSIENLNVGDAICKIKKILLIKKNKIIFKRLVIYILSVNIETLGFDYFDSDFYDRDVYTEFCCLLLKNSNYFKLSGKNKDVYKFIDRLSFSISEKNELKNMADGIEPTVNQMKDDPFQYWKNKNRSTIISGFHNFKSDIDDYKKKLKDLDFVGLLNFYNNSSDYEKHAGLETAIADNILLLFENKKIDGSYFKKMPSDILNNIIYDGHFEGKDELYVVFVKALFKQNLVLKNYLLESIFSKLFNIAKNNEKLSKEIFLTLLNYNKPVSFSRNAITAFSKENLAEIDQSLPFIYFDSLFYLAIKYKIEEKYNILLKKLDTFCDYLSDDLESCALTSFLFTYIEIILRNNRNELTTYLNNFENGNPNINYGLFRLNGFLSVDRYLLFKSQNSFYEYLFDNIENDLCSSLRDDYINYILHMHFTIECCMDDLYDLLIEKKCIQVMDWLINYSGFATPQKYDLFKEYLIELNTHKVEEFKDNNNICATIDSLSKLILDGIDDELLWQIIYKLSNYFGRTLHDNFFSVMKKNIGKNKYCYKIYLNILRNDKTWFAPYPKTIERMFALYQLFSSNEKDRLYSFMQKKEDLLNKLIYKINKL